MNDDKEWALRLFSHPFVNSGNFYLRGLGVGVAGTVTDQKGSNTQTLLSSFRTPAGQTFFSYRGAAAAAGATPASNATIRSSAPPRAAMPTSDHAPHCTLVAARTHARRHVASASRHAFAAE